MAKELLTVLRLDDADFTRNLSKDQKQLLGFAGAATAVGAALAASALSAAEYSDQVAKAARATGTTTETFSKFQYIAKLSDVSVEELAKGMKKLIEPTAQTEMEMARFGVSLKKSNGQMKSQEEILGDLSKQYKNLSNPADKALLAITAFGEKGSKLANVLDSDFEELAKEAEAMGLIVTSKVAAASELFNDNITRLEQSAFGLNKTIGDSIVQWVNQTGVLEKAAKAIQSVTQWINSIDDETKNAVISATAAGAAVVILAAAFYFLGPAVASAAASFLALEASVLLPVAAIALLAAGVVYLESKFSIFSAAIEALSASFRELKIALQPAIEAVGDLFKIDFSKKIDFKKIFEDAGEAVVRGVAFISAKLTDLVKSFDKASQSARILGDILRHGLTAAVYEPKKLQKAIDELNASLKEGGEIAFADAMPRVEAAAKKYRDELAKVKKAQDDVKNDQPQTSGRTAGPAVEGFKGTIDKLKTSFDDAGKGLDVFKKSFSQLDFIGMSRGAEQFAQSINEIAQVAAKTAAPALDIMSRMADIEGQKAKKTTDNRLYQLDILNRLNEQAYQQELAQLTAAEDAKLQALKNSQAMQLEILNAGKAARLAALDDEFAQEKAKRDAKFAQDLLLEQMRFEADTQKFLDATRLKEEREIIKEEQENSWREREAALKGKHETDLATLASEFQARKSTAEQEEAKKSEDLKRATDAEITAQEEAKNKRIEELQKKKEEQDKKSAKMQALIQWVGQRAALESQKGLQSAQIMVSAITGASQAFSALAWIPIVGPVLGAAAAATILSLGSAQSRTVRQQQIPPPVELLFGSGGVTRGASHAAGGMNMMVGGRPANVEGQEAVIDRGRTRDLFGFIDGLTDGQMARTTTINSMNVILPNVHDARGFARELDTYLKKDMDSQEAVGI